MILPDDKNPSVSQGDMHPLKRASNSCDSAFLIADYLG